MGLGDARHVFDWLARRPVVEGDEDAIRRLPPWAALLVFALPSLMLFPVRLLALWLIAHGQRVLGVTVIPSPRSSARRWLPVYSR